MHIVMRSSAAKGRHSFLRHGRAVESLLRKQSKDQGVRVYDLANAGNHLHIIAKFPSRRAYKAFLRAISGLLVRLSLGVKRGVSLSNVLGTKATQFWDARPFSRIVAWGKDYAGLKNYLLLNRIEIHGVERRDAREMLAEISAFQRNGLLAFGFDDVDSG